MVWGGGGEGVWERVGVCYEDCKHMFFKFYRKNFQVTGNQWELKMFKKRELRVVPFNQSKFLYGRRLMLKGKAFETMYINLGS